METPVGPAGGAARAEAPLIIGGCHRSGTTLLRRLLNAHSRIFCGPEVKFFRDFWGDYVSDDLAHIRFFTTVRSLGLSDDELMDIFGRAYVACLDHACAKAGKKRWAEKNPENVLCLDAWNRLLDGRFFFILMVRHPLDTIASMMEFPFPKSVPNGFEGKIEAYRRFVGHGMRFLDADPAAGRIVRYEDLVRRPEETLSGLCAAIGESFEPRMLDTFNDQKEQDWIEDPKIGTQNEIHNRSVGRYRRDLQPVQIHSAVVELDEFFGRFGYDLPDE